MAGVRGGEREPTSTSFSLVISPVEACPDGVGRSDVQCSPIGGVGVEGAGAALEVGGERVSSCASLSGDFVANSGELIVTFGYRQRGELS